MPSSEVVPLYDLMVLFLIEKYHSVHTENVTVEVSTSGLTWGYLYLNWILQVRLRAKKQVGLATLKYTL